jgi:hypothetical protein
MSDTRPLRLFVADHDGLALGGITIVFAFDEDSARSIVLGLLAENKLRPKIFDVREFPVEHGATMIWNGDY